MTFVENKVHMNIFYNLFSVINNKKLSRQSTYVLFINVLKAFDKVNHQCLWYKLMKIGIAVNIFKQPILYMKTRGLVFVSMAALLVNSTSTLVSDRAVFCHRTFVDLWL